MTDTWIVLVEDRHSDVDALPFSTEEAAVKVAREQMVAIVAHPERIQEVPLTPDLRECRPEPLAAVVKRVMDDTGRLR